MKPYRQPMQEPLRKHLRRDGFDFNQVQRIGNVAIYLQTKANCPRFKSWAVVIIKTRRGGIVFGQSFPAYEAFPSANQWGSLGWSCATLERAQERLSALLTLAKAQNSPPTAPCTESGRPGNGSGSLLQAKVAAV